MSNSFTISVVLPVSQKQLYDAWLDSKEHSAFTGSPAKVNPRVGGAFSAWDGYISGKTLELKPYSRIVQSWRTTEFQKKDPDLLLEVLITKSGKGSKLTLKHSQLPPGQLDEYKTGWRDFYFKPMKEYFRAKTVIK
jgi:activator of HSP90 ATPase